MSQINGRSLEQVRRYDLFKLLVAVLLFIAWLFFTDRIPTVPAGDAAGTAADVPAAPPAVSVVPAQLRILSIGGRVRLQGSVPDEATRNEYLAAARGALGRTERVEDGLDVVAGAGRPGWLAHVGPAILAIAGHDGVSAAIEEERVVLAGSVPDEAQRTGLADEVTASFGAPFTVVNRLVITASVRSTAPATAPGAGTPAASTPAASTPSTAASSAATPAATSSAATSSAAISSAAISSAATSSAATSSAATSSAASSSAASSSAATAPAPASATGASTGASAAPTASAPAAPSTPSPAPSPAPAGASTPGSAPALRIAPAPVSVFFEEGVTTLSAGDEDKLAPLARHAREAGVSLRVSGFHSKTGSAQRNAEIAKERAIAVRERLLGLGVAADRVILDKPQETLGEEDDRRARRVDVGLDG